MPETEMRSYAFFIKGPFGDRELDLSARNRSCQTCGHPFFQAGAMCPECAEAFTRNMQAAAEGMAQWLNDIPRMVHVYGVGHVDPWTREGKQYLDG